MTDDYWKSEEYKQKYEALMERCAKFMSEFAPPSPYEIGFKAGWEAAKQEFHKGNTYVPDTTKPAKTMDLQWPRDKESWPPITTTPWPPGHNERSHFCSLCRIDLNKNTHYVCVHPNCTSQIRFTSIVTKDSTT